MSRTDVHEEILELLPWLVNESLSDKEQLRVTNHLKVCNRCREERDHLQRLQAVVSEDDGTLPDYRDAFQRLEARIDFAEANRSSVAEVPALDSKSVKPRGGARGFGWFTGLGIAASLFVGYLVGAGTQATDTGELAAQGQLESTPEYVTLTSTASSHENGVLHRVYLTFDQPVQAETIRTALIETGSQIVSGPDQSGTYAVNISVPAELTDIEFLNSIRQIKGVQYAGFTQMSDTHPGR